MSWAEIISPELWARIGMSLLCGMVVGIERQLRGKPAGIRTSVLICMGSMAYVQLCTVFTRGDPTRIIGQIVTGVGFLGAGVILSKGGLVRGVTSAAVVWVLAAIGCAIGFDRFGMAVALSISTVATLVGVELLEEAFAAFRRGVHSPSPPDPHEE